MKMFPVGEDHPIALYFAKCGKDCYMKIGHSKNVSKSLNKLILAGFRDVELLAVVYESNDWCLQFFRSALRKRHLKSGFYKPTKKMLKSIRKMGVC